MAGNSIGVLFKVTTFGESHGSAIGAIVDGVPPNVSLCEDDLQVDLDRRKPGNSKYTTKRQETDKVKILSGVFEGKTTGTPIALIIENSDHRSSDYSDIFNKFRPNHGDFTYFHKYAIRDYRGGGRASARETAMRVAAGSIAKKYLKEHFNISINAFITQIGNVKIADEFLCNINKIDFQAVNNNPFFTPDIEATAKFDELIRQIKKEGDSIGAKICVVAQNVPIGLGEPVFDRLDADLAKALMSINAVKGVEIGDGFGVVSQKGSEHNDPISKDGFVSNNSGGILAGISNGESIVAHIALKPTPSISIPMQSVTTVGEEVEIVSKGRHDPCVGIRAVPIAEAMMAITLMDHLLRVKAQCW